MSSRDLSRMEYAELADLRYQIRQFLHFSEGVALQEGIEPRQHQALLAIKAMPEQDTCTIGALAQHLFLRHQSTVGLVDRLERRGLVARTSGQEDGRRVIVALSREGEAMLCAMCQGQAPELARVLQ